MHTFYYPHSSVSLSTFFFFLYSLCNLALTLLYVYSVLVCDVVFVWTRFFRLAKVIQFRFYWKTKKLKFTTVIQFKKVYFNCRCFWNIQNKRVPTFQQRQRRALKWSTQKRNANQSTRGRTKAVTTNRGKKEFVYFVVSASGVRICIYIIRALAT